jgi:hypothetical protein
MSSKKKKVSKKVSSISSSIIGEIPQAGTTVRALPAQVQIIDDRLDTANWINKEQLTANLPNNNDTQTVYVIPGTFLIKYLGVVLYSNPVGTLASVTMGIIGSDTLYQVVDLAGIGNPSYIDLSGFFLNTKMTAGTGFYCTVTRRQGGASSLKGGIAIKGFYIPPFDPYEPQKM